MTDIFISYSRRDLGKAEKLAGFLLEQGYSVWWDRDLHAGQQFRERILEVIKQCTAVIVIWSDDSIQSRWVLDESDAAASVGKLIPVRADEFDPAKIPLGFGSLHTIALSDRNGLLTALKAHFASPPKPLSRASTVALRWNMQRRRLTKWFTWKRATAAAVLLLVGGYAGANYLDWLIVRDSVEARDFQHHLDRFPYSFFAAQARTRIEGANEWQRVRSSRSSAELRAYIEKFPGAIHGQFARVRLARLLAVETGKYTPVLPESGKRLLNASDLEQLNCQRLWTARNEIFYVLGRCFVSDAAISAFRTRDDCPYTNCKMIDHINTWVGEIVTHTEVKNVDQIKKTETEKGCWVQEVRAACQR